MAGARRGRERGIALAKSRIEPTSGREATPSEDKLTASPPLCPVREEEPGEVDSPPPSPGTRCQ
jgi:hypothetical protein